MSTKVIGDYSAAVTIDGSTHYLLIQPGSSSTAYNKINRNVFLGITGQPMDINTIQTMSNKILDNTNTITVRDGVFTLQDDVDLTKQARFQLSGITTATTRTYTLPNASSTLADIATVQTFTNKTLTSPVITSGSITGTSITTDAIVGQSSATSGTIYGLSISSSKVGSNGIITASITDAAVTPTKLTAGTGSSWTFQSWVPTWTNLTVSGSTVTAKYVQIGKNVFYHMTVVLAGGNVPSGVVSFTLPITSITYPGTSTLPHIGDASYFITNSYSGYVVWKNTTSANLIVSNAASTYTQDANLSATVPNTFVNGSEIHCQGWYEAA